MTDSLPPDPPSLFVETWINRLAAQCGGGRALDVAMGRGRHSVVLAAAGLHVFGVDNRFEVVQSAVERVRTRGHRLAAWCADLTMSPLPARRFDVIVVVRYLQRDLFPTLITALKPGGAIVYETFTVLQRGRGRGPQSADHLLGHGELRERLTGCEILFETEVVEPDALAQIVARRPR